MSSRFNLQKPHAVATLPKSIDKSSGHYAVGEVFGGVPGSRKRKRSELAVGIDGEGVNIYDITASRLITSYALPPQAALTCPPTSLRIRASKNEVERRTYVSTSSSNPQIICFHESTAPGCSPETRSSSQDVEGSASPVIFLGTITSTKAIEAASKISNIVAVKQDGEILSVDGETLKGRWTSPASALFRDATSSVRNVKVEYATLTDAYSAGQGILKSRPDVFTLYPEEVTKDGFNPELLVLITSSGRKSKTKRLHVVSFPRRAISESSGHRHSVEVLLSIPIPVSREASTSDFTLFSIHSSTGVLQQLAHNILTTYDLTNTLPVEVSSINSSDAKSFLRLSNTSVLVSGPSSISAYNPQYISRLATTPIEISTRAESKKRKRSEHDGINGVIQHQCQLISYFPKLGTAMAIIDNTLVGIQVGSKKSPSGKADVDGLLIDSLRCSVPTHEKAEPKSFGMLEFLTLEQNSSFGKPDQTFASLISPIEKAFAAGECSESEFDSFMSKYLPFQWLENGVTLKVVNGDVGRKFDTRTSVDRRWVIYALSKIFTASEMEKGLQLSVEFYPTDTFWALLQGGFLTVENIESALQYADSIPKILPPGQLVNTLVSLDLDLELLVAAIQKNYFSAGELLHAIRVLMESIGMMGQDASIPAQLFGLLTNGEFRDSNSDILDEQIRNMEEQADEAITQVEYQIGPGADYRTASLTVAIEKLYQCSEESIVRALQTQCSAQEIVSLVLLFRRWLNTGGWTSSYLDRELDEETEDTEEPEPRSSAIILLATMLNCCIDAIGAQGWMTGAARLQDDARTEAEALIKALKTEISLALIAVNEANYTKSFIAEYLRYASRLQKDLPNIERDMLLAADVEQGKTSMKPVTLSLGSEAVMTPLGGKVEKQVSQFKIGATGDIHKRTARDIGDQKSRRVGKYSRERIII